MPGLPGGPAFGVPVGDGASGADRLPGTWRRPVENLFVKTGEFRAIATRCDRTDGSFAAGIHPVVGVVAAT